MYRRAFWRILAKWAYLVCSYPAMLSVLRWKIRHSIGQITVKCTELPAQTDPFWPRLWSTIRHIWDGMGNIWCWKSNESLLRSAEPRGAQAWPNRWSRLLSRLEPTASCSCRIARSRHSWPHLWTDCCECFSSVNRAVARIGNRVGTRFHDQSSATPQSSSRQFWDCLELGDLPLPTCFLWQTRYTCV